MLRIDKTRKFIDQLILLLTQDQFAISEGF